jgi:hypothetical protein
MAIRIDHAIATVLGIGILSCTAAAARDCKSDTARFCPEIDQVTAMPREQVMCLKTYRVDLTRDCRTALAAVKSATETEQ